VLAGTAAGAGRTAPPTRLEYRTPAGIVYVITNDGLSEVRHDTRVLAQGGWRFGVADAQWGRTAGKVDAATITGRSLDVVSPTEARVTHVHTQVTVRHTFTFAGEDVRIESYVENRHPADAIEVAAFGGPKVDFGRVPIGILPIYQPYYTLAGPPPLMHPGGIRIGGSYGVGDGFGVGAAPHSAGRFRTAILWDWDWSPQVRDKDHCRTPTMYVNAPIPAGGARTFAATFRFSPTTDWKHLLDPYRRHLHATLGDRTRYDRPSHFPLVQSVVCGPEAQRGLGNPHAYDPGRRLDTLYSINNTFGSMALGMRSVHAQGLVIWGQSGLHPRGAMYRPDFDALPPEVVPNIVRLAELLKEQGMTLGLTARPGQIATPLDWTTDTVSSIHPDRPEELELLTHRFNVCIARGARLFYLDSAGNQLDDVAILRAVRDGVGKEKGVGRDVQTFVEHPSDVVVPYSGLLPVLGYAGKGESLVMTFEAAFWLNPPETPTMPEIMRYFYPDVPVVALVSGLYRATTVERKEAAVAYCYERRMAAMIPDHWFDPKSEFADRLNALTRKYLTPEGNWKAKSE
jgi:hypothetical protein